MTTPRSDAEVARDRFFERTRRPVQLLVAVSAVMRAVRNRLWNHPEMIVAAQAGRASQTESAEPAASGLPSNQP
jgi:hypothetical protein